MKKINFRKLRKEDGNSFLMFIFLMPVLSGAFGLGLDTALGQYTRTGIQNAADSATVAGAAQTKYVGNKKVIDINKATAMVKTMYNEQRLNYPNVTRTEPEITVQLIPGRNAGDPQTLKVFINEKSPTLFLHMAGVSEFKYNIVSSARLGYLVERK